MEAKQQRCAAIYYPRADQGWPHVVGQRIDLLSDAEHVHDCNRETELIESPISNHDVIAQFMRELFARADHGQIEVNVRNGRFYSKLFSVGALDDCINFCIEHAASAEGVYVSAGLRRSDLPYGKSGTNKDVIAVTALKLDIDDKAAAATALAKLVDADLTPNLIVTTGAVPFKRLHLWWLLEEPCNDIATVQAIEKMMIKALGADSTADPRRMMRLPGSVNHPNEKKKLKGRVPETVKMERGRQGRYTIDEIRASAKLFSEDDLTVKSVLESALPTASALDIPTSPNPAQSIVTGSKLARLLSEVKPGNWHNPIRDAVAHLVTKGIDDEGIQELLKHRRLSDYTIEQTRENIQKLIDGARRKDWPQTEAAPRKYPEPISWTPVDPTSFPKFPFIYRDYLCRGYLSLTVSPGGIGKSTLSLIEAVSMAIGRDLLGFQLNGEFERLARTKVWYFNLEDPMDLIMRRVAGTCLHYDIDQAELSGRLFINSGLDDPLVTAIEKQKKTQLDEPLFQHLTSKVGERDIGAIIIDPFVSSHQVDENNNRAIDMVAKRWSKFASDNQVAVAMVHHTRKNVGGTGFDTDSARGAKALTDAARIVRVLNGASKGAIDMKGAELRQYFKAEIDKSNLAPIRQKPTWYRKLSVELGNGSEGEPSDTIGVIEPWDPPESEQQAVEPDKEKIEAIVKGLGSERYRYHHKSENWVGILIADLLGWDLQEDGIEKSVKAMIDSLISQGVLLKAKEKGEASKYQPFVRVSPERLEKCGIGDSERQDFPPPDEVENEGGEVEPD